MILAECFFVDVGQGAAQVLHTRDGETIVIDCGRSSRVLQTLLREHLGVKRISALILSHNDADHVGGLGGLLATYCNRIDRVYLLQDRGAGELKSSEFYDQVAEATRKRCIPRPIPLLRVDKPHWLFPFHKHSKAPVRVEILFPDFLENIDGQATGDPNATSAVILVHCGCCRVLFPGDSPLATWEAIRRKRRYPIECDVLAVPHHGGRIADREQMSEEDLEWLYFEAITCWYAVISVGTNNPYGHPLAEHIEALRLAGATILCTEITKVCCNQLQELHPGVLLPQQLPRLGREAGRQTSKGAVTHVACAGTVLVQFGWDEVEVHRADDHERAVREKLVSDDGAPPCVGKAP